MSLLYNSGFDLLANPSDLASHENFSAADTIEISNITALGAGKSVHLLQGAYWQNPTLRKLFDANQAGKTVIAGFRLKTSRSDFVLYELGSDANSAQVQLKVSNNGFLQVVVNNAVVATGTTKINDDSWRYIEAKFLVDSEAGVYGVRINENDELLSTGINVQSQPTNAIDYFKFTGPDVYIDDFYVLNGAGADHNDYLGDVEIIAMALSGDNAINWMGSDGNYATYANLNKTIGSFNDASYNYSDVAGKKDKYQVTGLDFTASLIFCVTLHARVQKNDTGVKQFKLGTETGEASQSQTFTPGIGFAKYSAVFPYSDSVGTAWTEASLNAVLATIEVG